jgi:hypothetical protein
MALPIWDARVGVVGWEHAIDTTGVGNAPAPLGWQGGGKKGGWW